MKANSKNSEEVEQFADSIMQVWIVDMKTSELAQ